MTVDRDILATRIAKIRQELRHLARLQDLSRDEPRRRDTSVKAD